MAARCLPSDHAFCNFRLSAEGSPSSYAHQYPRSLPRILKLSRGPFDFNRPQTPFQWKTIPQGAATSVWAGVVASADEIGGRYCENCHVGNVVPDEVTISAISEGVRGYALDPKNAEALWKKSEELVGESF